MKEGQETDVAKHNIIVCSFSGEYTIQYIFISLHISIAAYHTDNLHTIYNCNMQPIYK